MKTEVLRDCSALRLCVFVVKTKVRTRQLTPGAGLGEYGFVFRPVRLLTLPAHPVSGSAVHGGDPAGRSVLLHGPGDSFTTRAKVSPRSARCAAFLRRAEHGAKMRTKVSSIRGH